MKDKALCLRVQPFTSRLMRLVRCAFFSWGCSCFFSSACLTATESPLQSLVNSHTQFAFSLYNAALTEESSPLFSPYSVATCLSMLYLGAKGETQSQLAQALFLQVNPEEIAPLAALLSASLPALNNHSALFVAQEAAILSLFRKSIETQFKASIIPVNFINPKQAANQINRWISNATSQKIPSLIAEKDLSTATRLVLLNALYYEGVFDNPFASQNTKEAPFFPTVDTQIQLPFMEQTESILYYENEIMQMGALPLKHSSLALLLVLPKSAENSPMVLKELEEQFTSWISSLALKKIHIKMPKWNQSFKLNLKPLLQKLGVTTAFTESADFSGIDGALDLILSEAIHQTDMVVSEAGLIASSGTGVVMNLKTTPGTPIPFYLNHPFFFLVVDRQSHEILFLGRFAK